MSNIKDELELLSKPGDTIAETLEHLRMTQAQLAERMGKTTSKINDLISGKEPITMTTAMQLEKVLGIEAQFWLNREMIYREKLTRLEQEQILESAVDWLKMQPIKELKKCGYIKTDRIGTAMVYECLRFYGVAATDQWQSIYIDQYASTNFRKSQAHQTALGSMAAWLRIGEVEMRKLNLPSYEKDKFKKALGEVRKLVKNHPEDFAERVQQLCLEAGVGVVYTICVSKAPISGATRWIGGNPLIQLTDRYKSNDHFWFTFFHEAGHVLLHGKKDVFIEDFEGYILDKNKEKEANDFAIKWLLPEDIMEDFGEEISENSIRQVARKHQTHAAIILGHLQHLKIVPYSFGASLKLKVLLDNMINKKGE